MSIKLPQEARTAKVETLPDDLKSIAEQMLAEKFGVKEEVVERNAPDPFRRMVHETQRNVDGFYGTATEAEFYGRNGRQRGYYDVIQTQIQPWDGRKAARLRIPEPNVRSLARALDRFRMERIEDNIQFVLTPQFYNYLRQDPEFFQYGEIIHRNSTDWRENVQPPSVAKILGVDIIITPKINESFISAYFRS